MVSRDEHGETAAAWEAAWTGGRRAVHLGNVADFNTQFMAGRLDDRRQLDWRRQGHHYASLAVFYSPHPAVVVLPRVLDDAWLGLVSRQLEWDAVELYSGIAEDGGFGEAVEARPALLGRLRGMDLPLLAWGRTPEFERLAGLPDDGVLAAVMRFESKESSLTLFREIARNHPGIAVRDQQRVGSVRRLTRLVADRASAGRTVVLKSEYGVGGNGTAIVTPGQVRAAGGARALLRQLFADEDLLSGHDVLVEPYVWPSRHLRDPTFDAVIAQDGSVHPVGMAVMYVEGTKYRGATVGPGLVPAELADRATRFGIDVGRALAEQGYRGWFDIDFIAAQSGQLAPAETNLRLTGPAIAFMIKARLDLIRGPGHLVRTLDELPLGARMPEELLFQYVQRLVRLCSPLGAIVLPILPSTGFEPFPTLGVAIAARSVEVLDAAENLIRGANAALGEMGDASAGS
jgi:hypothetical protein